MSDWRDGNERRWMSAFEQWRLAQLTSVRSRQRRWVHWLVVGGIVLAAIAVVWAVGRGWPSAEGAFGIAMAFIAFLIGMVLRE